MNPYSVDETHGASTYLEFSVAAKESVQCVEVISRTKGPGGVARQYYPSEMTLHRGWSSNERKESDITMVDSIIDVDGWTEMWKTTADESMMDADKGRPRFVFFMPCMTSDCIYFTLKIDIASTLDTCVDSIKAEGQGRCCKSLICLRIWTTYEDKARVGTGEALFLSIRKLFALSSAQ